MKNSRLLTKLSVVLLSMAAIMMFTASPIFAGNDSSEIIFEDSDALGSYGDENDEEVLDETTSLTEIFKALTIIATAPNTSNSSVIVDGNPDGDPDGDADNGYGEGAVKR